MTDFWQSLLASTTAGCWLRLDSNKFRHNRRIQQGKSLPYQLVHQECCCHSNSTTKTTKLQSPYSGASRNASSTFQHLLVQTGVTNHWTTNHWTGITKFVLMLCGNNHFREWLPSTSLIALQKIYSMGLLGTPDNLIAIHLDSSNEGSRLTQLMLVPHLAWSSILSPFKVRLDSC